MRIEIYSDTICPWCLIGKRRLARALAERPQPELEITWRAFQLNPAMPAEGMERQRYLELKFGGAERAAAVYQPIKEIGEEEGIGFAFDKIQRTPSTLDSHRLLRLAQTQRPDVADDLLDRIFAAYFFDGVDIGDREALVQLATTAGFDTEAVRTYLNGDQNRDAVAAEDTRAREIGIQGVPTYIFEGKYVLSGAHPPEVLFRLFDLVSGKAGAEELQQSG
ncbi:MAG: DsbA family oxidoreductase [Pseudomonadota bacterium]